MSTCLPTITQQIYLEASGGLFSLLQGFQKTHSDGVSPAIVTAFITAITTVIVAMLAAYISRKNEITRSRVSRVIKLDENCLSRAAAIASASAPYVFSDIRKDAAVVALTVSSASAAGRSLLEHINQLTEGTDLDLENWKVEFSTFSQNYFSQIAAEV